MSAGAVIERDWQSPGDGLLTYDTVNHREWLDLTVSDISQFPAPYVDNAIAEVQPGGLFDGFTLATVADVTALGASAGIDTSTIDFSSNEAATRQLAELLGPTFSRPADNAVFAVGWLADFITLPGHLDSHRASADFAVNPSATANGISGLFVASGSGDDLASYRYHAGLMLYRQFVPEPPAGMLTLIWLMAFRVNHVFGGRRTRPRRAGAEPRSEDPMGEKGERKGDRRAYWGWSPARRTSTRIGKRGHSCSVENHLWEGSPRPIPVTIVARYRRQRRLPHKTSQVFY
jgi:hypothetical protein